MQKREKMVARISGVVTEPVTVARWWRVSRRSWATRSAGMPERRAARSARLEFDAASSAAAWRALVINRSALAPPAKSSIDRKSVV